MLHRACRAALLTAISLTAVYGTAAMRGIARSGRRGLHGVPVAVRVMAVLGILLASTPDSMLQRSIQPAEAYSFPSSGVTINDHNPPTWTGSTSSNGPIRYLPVSWPADNQWTAYHFE